MPSQDDPIREHQLLAQERTIRAAERAHDLSKETELRILEFAGRDAQEAMKVALAINGGAAIAVMAFSSAMAYKGGIALADLGILMVSLGLFASGVVLAAITAGLAYFVNSLYSASHGAKAMNWEHPFVTDTDASQKYWRWARRLNWIAVICAAMALVLFVGGLVVAGMGIWSLASAPHARGAG